MIFQNFKVIVYGRNNQFMLFISCILQDVQYNGSNNNIEIAYCVIVWFIMILYFDKAVTKIYIAISNFVPLFLFLYVNLKSMLHNFRNKPSPVIWMIACNCLYNHTQSIRGLFMFLPIFSILIICKSHYLIFKKKGILHNKLAECRGKRFGLLFLNKRVG